MTKNNQLVDATSTKDFITTKDFATFTDAANSIFCPMVCNQVGGTAKNFHGELFNTRLDRIHLARISTSALRVDRRKQDIAQHAGDASFLVKFQLDGEALVKHRGREAHLQSGDFVMCTTNEPYQLRFPSDYNMATLAVPHAVLHNMFKSPEDFLGIKMCGSSPVHGLLSQFINSLVDRIDHLDPEITQRLEANILDLLVTSLHAEMRNSHEHAPTKALCQLDEIRRFIAMNLRDYQLSIDVIAKAHGISKRYLHLLFQQEGVSVSRYIQQQRLESCHRALLSAEMRHLSTTEIALTFGFGDLSHFYRCFKAQFGITPGQLREQTPTQLN